MELTVQMEKPSNILRKLTIRVPAKTVSSRLERGLVDVQRTAKLKGFRPGHAPLSVIKQYYGDDVRHQVLHDLIDESFQKAVKDENIRTVGSPRIETPDHKTGEGAHDHAIKDGQDLTFTATVEILPEVEVKSYLGLSVAQEKSDVSDADVEVVIKNLLDSQAQLVPVDHAAKKGDFAHIAFDGGIVTETGVEAHPGMKGSRDIEIGSNALIPGFEDNLIGMSKGETKTFRVPFPKDYHDAKVAGKDSEFTVTVNEVKEKKVPALDEEFVKKAGYESVEDLRKKAHEHLVRERTQEVDRKLRSDLLQELINKNSFDVPQSLIQAQTRALAQDVAQNLKSQGFTDQMAQEALASEFNNLKTRAEKQVRASLLLEAIAKKEGIEVKPDEADAELKKIAESMKVEEARIREFYAKNPGRMEDMTFRMREERTVEFLISKAKIKKAK